MLRFRVKYQKAKIETIWIIDVDVKMKRKPFRRIDMHSHHRNEGRTLNVRLACGMNWFFVNWRARQWFHLSIARFGNEKCFIHYSSFKENYTHLPRIYIFTKWNNSSNSNNNNKWNSTMIMMTTKNIVFFFCSVMVELYGLLWPWPCQLRMRHVMCVIINYLIIEKVHSTQSEWTTIATYSYPYI